jgi:dTDP-4-amino-4,6-dideoxygalactose transaminase
MTDLQGAVGLVQLGKLDKFIDDRINWRLDRLEGLINDAEKALIKISDTQN